MLGLLPIRSNADSEFIIGGDWQIGGCSNKEEVGSLAGGVEAWVRCVNWREEGNLAVEHQISSRCF